ncbi:uncharacterized protein LOC131257957 isoform X2 [Magnolia sinica]|uniref:uncharacterized protein LOC131257957 isoform X2 n=1 Tax=Magnolia sinica TaxID=86752 RepID=UPI002658E82F|nr:uncharacterized protein LOC131257957 isoform X2 [Magnolia sinica]
MLPFMPSFPSLPNQIQAHGSNDSNQQQVNSSNPSSNLTHPFSCSSCTHQIPPQLHALNSQFLNPVMMPFNNGNTHLSNLHGNGIVIPNGPPSMPSHRFPNAAANNHHMVQNGYVGMPQNSNQVAPSPIHGQFCNLPQNLNQMAFMQPNGQFLPQNHLQNMNQIMLAGCLHAQNLNKNMPLQPLGQCCAHNLPQSLNQLMGLPNAQFCSNQMQNFNQVLPSHCLQHPMSHTHVSPLNIHPSSQPPHVPGSQNPNFSMNPQLAAANSNVNPNNAVLSNEATKFNNQDPHIFSPSIVGQNAIQGSSVATQHLQGSLFPSLAQGPAQILQPQKNMQPGGFNQSQGNGIQGGNNNVSNINQGSPTTKNFNRNLHGSGRFQKSQFHNVSNATAKFTNTAGNWGKGNCNRGAAKPHPANSNKKAVPEFKRSLPLTYTEEEIRQWREERKKNFPSKSNMEKQLKDILAKQAELGVEVAEIPPNYLSETENQGGKRDDMKMGRNRKGRFRNKYDKRGDHGRENGWAKKQKLEQDKQSLPSVPSKRNPTLLEKLLSADIKRDKSHLLQVFRFMMLNSFFEGGPKKLLEFPLITVKDVGLKDEIDKGKVSLRGGDDAVSAKETESQPQDLSVVDDDDDDQDSKGEVMVYGYVSGKGCATEQIEKPEAEEGEITD